MEPVDIPPKYKYANAAQSSKFAIFIRERWMLVASIVIVAVILLSLGIIFWVLSRPVDQSPANSATNKPTPTPTTKPTVTPTPTPTPTPEPTPTSTPTPIPTPSATQIANVTPFTPDDCNGANMAYVANPNGTPVSNQSPDSWHTTRTYQFGQRVSIYCEIGEDEYMPAFALVNEAYISTSDLSTTKPEIIITN